MNFEIAPAASAVIALLGSLAVHMVSCRKLHEPLETVILTGTTASHVSRWFKLDTSEKIRFPCASVWLERVSILGLLFSIASFTDSRFDVFSHFEKAQLLGPDAQLVLVGLVGTFFFLLFLISNMIEYHLDTERPPKMVPSAQLGTSSGVHFSPSNDFRHQPRVVVRPGEWALDNSDPPRQEEQLPKSTFKEDIRDYPVRETIALSFGTGNTFDDVVDAIYDDESLSQIPHSFLGGIAIQVPRIALPELSIFFAERGIAYKIDNVYSTANLSQDEYNALKSFGPRAN